MNDLSSHIVGRIREAKALLIGCSAGGFGLIYDIVLSLPANFPIPVIVIIHRSRKYKSSMEELLNSKSRICVKLAEGKEKIKKGYVYFAPPDYHLLLEPDDVITLDTSEPVMYCRPSIDVTFQSVADVYKEKVIALLLSGANADGADGILYIHNKKGIVGVQDPNVAEVRTMPEAAISRCKADLILNNTQIFSFIDKIGSIINSTRDGQD